MAKHRIKIIPKGSAVIAPPFAVGAPDTSRQMCAEITVQPKLSMILAKCPSVMITGPALADYCITGELTPDSTGDYYEMGIYSGYPYYRKLVSAWFIWTFNNGVWFISAELGNNDDLRWEKNSPGVVGTYQPVSGAVGQATVSNFNYNRQMDCKVTRFTCQN